MFKRILIILVGLLLVCRPVFGARQIRPLSGSGILIVRPLDPERPAEMASIPFFRDPGVARIAEFSAGQIPCLTTILDMPAGEYPYAVMGKKGQWLRIAYDDAGREGWMVIERWWDYIPWEKFLKGRAARLLAGLKRKACVLHETPAETASQTGVLAGQEVLRIVEVAGDWALVVADSGMHGWLPWRDEDGRFLIDVDGGQGVQKH